MKKFIIILILSNTMSCFAQDARIFDVLSRSPQLVYFGIDFSHAQIVGESDKHKQALQDSLMQKMNLKFLSDRIRWLKHNLSMEIIVRKKMIDSLNSNYSAIAIIPENDNIQKIIMGYPVSNQEGTGLVFLVASLDKYGDNVELYPVFFDISSKTIIWMNKESGTGPGGPNGLMDFWYSKVYNAIGDFSDKYKSLKAEHNVTIKPNKIFLKLLIDEIDIGYERTLSPDLNLSVEAGYRLNYIDSWDYEGAPAYVEYLYRYLCFHGFTVRVDLKYKISKRSYLGWVLGYQHLYCPDVIWQPGALGSDENPEYKVWSQHNDELVLQLLHHINLGNAPYPVQFFYGGGFKVCRISEHYSFDNDKPSVKVVNETTIQPLLTFGLIFKIGSF
jgi:hypothetical protein